MDEINYKKVKIFTEYITLGQLLKFEGVISEGYEAKLFVNSHQIKVNNEKNSQRGKKLYPGYKIVIDDKLFFEIEK
jgi:ribosome-associated protein